MTSSNRTFYGGNLHVTADNCKFFGSDCVIIGDNNTSYGNRCDIRGDNNTNFGKNCKIRGDNNTNHGPGTVLTAGDNYVDYTRRYNDDSDNDSEEEGLNIASWDSGGISVQMVSQGGRTSRLGSRPSTIRVGGSVGAIGRGAQGFVLASSGSGNVAVSGSGNAAASGCGSVSAISSVRADNGVAIGVNLGNAPVPEGATVVTPKLKKISSDTVLVEGTKLPTVNIGSIMAGNKTRIQGVLFKSKNDISVRTTERGIEVSGLAEEEVEELTAEQ